MREFKQQAQKSMQAKIRKCGGTPGRATAGTGVLKRADGGMIPSPPEKSSRKKSDGPEIVVNIITPRPVPPGGPAGAGMPPPMPIPPPAAPRIMPGPGGPMPMSVKRGGKVKKKTK